MSYSILYYMVGKCNRIGVVDINKIIITKHQLFSLSANIAIGGAILFVSSSQASISKQDAWITALIMPVLGAPVIWMYWFMGRLYPGMTYVGIINKVLGKWIGFVISAGFIFLCLLVAAHVTNNISNFVDSQGYEETPIYILSVVFMAAVVIAVLYGIETIARASELFIYFVTALFLITMLLVSPNSKIEYLQPVFEKGVVPALKGLFFLADISTFPMVILIMIFPLYTNNEKENKRALFKGYIWSSIIIFIAVLMPILVLGSTVTANLQYPTFVLAKEINLGALLTRLEFVVSIIWFTTQFMISVLCFYSGVIGLSELFGLKNHKKIVMPLGLIISVISMVAIPNSTYQLTWTMTVWPPYIATYGLLLPIFLLIVSFIKKQKSHSGKCP